jgi:uncharacterized glyoxalase superfamily protein PhnB
MSMTDDVPKGRAGKPPVLQRTHGNKVRMAIYLSVEAKRALVERAIEEGRSSSMVLEDALRAWLGLDGEQK